MPCMGYKVVCSPFQERQLLFPRAILCVKIFKVDLGVRTQLVDFLVRVLCQYTYLLLPDFLLISFLPTYLQIRFQARPSFNNFGGGFLSLLKSDIAIDDITFDSCNAASVSNQSLNCNFDNGDLCSWYQQPNDKDNFDWSLTNNTSPSVGTGPNRDHTSGKGRKIINVLHLLPCLICITIYCNILHVLQYITCYCTLQALSLELQSNNLV